MKLKKTYGYARLTRLITPSPDRIKRGVRSVSAAAVRSGDEIFGAAAF